MKFDHNLQLARRCLDLYRITGDIKVQNYGIDAIDRYVASGGTLDDLAGYPRLMSELLNEYRPDCAYTDATDEIGDLFSATLDASTEQGGTVDHAICVEIVKHCMDLHRTNS